MAPTRGLIRLTKDYFVPRLGRNYQFIHRQNHQANTFTSADKWQRLNPNRFNQTTNIDYCMHQRLTGYEIRPTGIYRGRVCELRFGRPGITWKVGTAVRYYFYRFVRFEKIKIMDKLMTAARIDHIYFEDNKPTDERGTDWYVKGFGRVKSTLSWMLFDAKGNGEECLYTIELEKVTMVKTKSISRN